MAKRYYMAFKTKEDFEKWFDEIYNDGRKHGAEDAIPVVLSYIYGPMADMYEKELPEAYRIHRNRELKQWQKQEEMRKYAAEKAIKEFMERHGMTEEEA